MTRAEQIIEALRAKPLHREQVARVVGITVSAAHTALSRMRRAGLVMHNGASRGTLWSLRQS